MQAKFSDRGGEMTVPWWEFFVTTTVLWVSQPDESTDVLYAKRPLSRVYRKV